MAIKNSKNCRNKIDHKNFKMIIIMITEVSHFFQAEFSSEISLYIFVNFGQRSNMNNQKLYK